MYSDKFIFHAANSIIIISNYFNVIFTDHRRTVYIERVIGETTWNSLAIFFMCKIFNFPTIVVYMHHSVL